MFLTTCPECKAKVDVADEDAVTVRCTSCGERIQLRESDEDREERKKKEIKKSRPKRRQVNYFIELLPILIAVPLSLFFLLLTCLFPKFFLVPLLGGFIISMLGFGKGCILAGEEGNYVGFDYLESLGGVRWVIVFLFFGIYLSGWVLLWNIAQIGCAVQQPKVFLPWLGLQLYGWVVFVGGIICAFIGSMIWATVW